MSEKIDEAMKLAMTIKDEAYEFASDPWGGSSSFSLSATADLLRPILAERDALRGPLFAIKGSYEDKADILGSVKDPLNEARQLYRQADAEIKLLKSERDALRVERDRVRESTLMEVKRRIACSVEGDPKRHHSFQDYMDGCLFAVNACMKIIDDALTASPSLDSAQAQDFCEWSQEEEFSDTWGGSCGITWTLIDDTPGANGMRFCPKCGKRLVERIAEAGK